MSKVKKNKSINEIKTKKLSPVVLARKLRAEAFYDEIQERIMFNKLQFPQEDEI